MAASIKASIDDTVDKTFGGDLVIVQDNFSGAGIDPAVDAMDRRQAYAAAVRD